MLLAPSRQAEIRQGSIDILKAYNIRAVTCGSLTRVQSWRNQAPEHIIPGFSFAHPSEVSVDELRQLYIDETFLVFAEMGTQYNGLTPGDPSLEPYFALAEELDIPVGIHMGLGPPGAYYLGNTQYRAVNSNPLLLEPVLMKHPKLRIYVMHAGWPMLDEMVHLLYSHPQVYVDLGIIDWGIPKAEFYFYLKRLINAGFGKRIMFGSDQMVWPDAIVRAIENIEAADFLTDGQKRDIFYHNAVRFFRTDFKNIADPHLIANWKLDEIEGNTAHDSAMQNDATVVGKAVWQPEDGHVEGALQFDGVSNYLSVPFILDPTKQPFSAYAWIKGGQPGQTIFSQQGAFGAWLFIDSTGKLATSLTFPLPAFASDVIVTEDHWFRVGLVSDGSGMSLYVDDIEVARSDVSPILPATGDLHIGAGMNLESGTFWSGLIDDVKIYDRIVKP